MPATLSSSNEQTILGPHPVKIGRAWDNQLVLNDPTVSSHHAEIRAQGQDYIIVDLGSTNGTFVNEQRLDRNVARLLISGDTIRIGEKIFTYYNDTGVTRTPSLPLNPFSFDEYEDSTLHSAKIGVKATGASFPAPPPPYTSRPPPYRTWVPFTNSSGTSTTICSITCPTIPTTIPCSLRKLSTFPASPYSEETVCSPSTFQ